uniref:Uncharacterized protein n=2 Tax=Cyprinus carpio TaxID=7962 RepID=A0A9J8CUX5_CYPCA
MVSEEELNYSKQEEDEKENEDADQEMNCEDDNDDGEALDLDLHEEDEPEKPKDRTCIPVVKRRAGSNSSSFTEGWVEFRDKRIKRSHFSSDLWSMKYLHRFQWCHLSERLLENLRKKKEKKGEVVEEKTIQDKAQSNVSLLAKIFSSGRAQEEIF